MEITKVQKVRQSNCLIESPYTQEYTSHEIKLFEIALAGILSDDINKANQRFNKRYSLTSNELAFLLNTSVSVISHEIEKTAKRIMKKTIHLRKTLDDGTIEFEIINIIPYARYKNGLLEFDLNYAVIPYLVEINKNFTEYQLRHLLSMNSAYAIKLYKLLYQYKNLKYRSFLVIELKNQFGIANKYVQHKDFRKRIIDPSIKQINELTDLKVSYKEIKCGRKIEKIEFFFTVKSLSEISNSQSNLSKDETLLIDNKIIEVNNNFPDELNKLVSDINHKISAPTKNCLLKYFHNKGAKYIQASIAYANDNAKTNYDKYLKDTLKNEWAEPYFIKLIMQERTQEKEEITKQEKLKEEQEKKLKREVAHAKKSAIESDYYKLTDKIQNLYIESAEKIFTQNYELLKVFSDIKNTLPIAIFAESNNRLQDYDFILVAYLKFHKIKLI
ncbi:replication initiation protein [Patescibacteria group bacterium]|nr:replication initiation protein [Patescibacteria group bacterium]